MTAPGDSILIFTLLALFVGCCAYAAGRLHQRYETKREREEAYRDGYETASKRVFSLAARTLVAKRGARGSAAVRGAGDEAPTVPVGKAAKARATGAAAAAADKSGSSQPGATKAAAPAGTPLATAASSVTPPLATDSPATPRPADAAASGTPRPADAAATSGTPRPSTAVTPGFPAPPPPPPQAVPEPAAVGGVTYQPFPDPRRSTDADPVSDPPPASGPGSGDSTPAVAAPQPSPTPAPDPTDEPRAGRHFVPDELVHAATYRLPPDRIFRARVPGGTPLPEEPTTPLAVPKPRRS